MRDLILKQCVMYNLTHDLNKCIENLQNMTTDFENEDEIHVYTEPAELMSILELIYFKLGFSFDEELNTLQDGHPELVGANQAILQLITKDLFRRHLSKLKAENFMKLVEEQIFAKGWSRYQYWQEVQTEMISRSVLPDTGDTFDEEEEEKQANLENQKKESYNQGLEAKLDQFKERFTDIASLTVKGSAQLVGLVKMKVLSKSVTVRLLGLHCQTDRLKLDLLYELLENIADVPRYEFNDFCEVLLEFLVPIERKLFLEDHQLFKRINHKLYNRIKGRCPALQEFLFTLKIEFVERCT